jgi:hypothetical protein
VARAAVGAPVLNRNQEPQPEPQPLSCPPPAPSINTCNTGNEQAVTSADVTLSLVEAVDSSASSSSSSAAASQPSHDAQRARAELLSAMGDEWATPTTAARKETSTRLSVEADAKELRGAALNGDIRKVEAQLTAAVDIDGRAGDGQSALFIACSEGYTRIVMALLAAKADTGLTNSQTLFTPLHAAAHGGHADCVAALLQAGADLGAKNRRGKTALQLASRKRHAAVTALLSASALAGGSCRSHRSSSTNGASGCVGGGNGGGSGSGSDEGKSFPHFTRVHWVAVPQTLLARRTNRRRQRRRDAQAASCSGWCAGAAAGARAEDGQGVLCPRPAAPA